MSRQGHGPWGGRGSSSGSGHVSGSTCIKSLGVEGVKVTPEKSLKVGTNNFLFGPGRRMLCLSKAEHWKRHEKPEDHPPLLLHVIKLTKKIHDDHVDATPIV
jgi:hypothetical protein